jgi:hypothetical protein
VEIGRDRQRKCGRSLENQIDASKHVSQSISIEDGMQVPESDEQDQNADDAICKRLGSASNATFERTLHSAKQYPPMTSTDDGKQIDESDEQE